ncbi:MGH1-like glycoside hydrolase domain-containing protein [Flagellimonas myxillae]|uniref:MGH1-like glycoside hydrolase domain-containing protein n=1 Tax=Flagellimonas myxillae TaxID=2942214 RepID=UPI00201E9C86|nr:trehalase family glycosidase [Muricauda myxillae]MCL6267738.1 trehalase [Muricauda myxillae]
MEDTRMDNYFFSCLLLMLLLFGCGETQESPKARDSFKHLALAENILDFLGDPKDTRDRDMLMFSDQGAWFAYSIPNSGNSFSGFSGPYLMTQENGVWASRNLTQIELTLDGEQEAFDWEEALSDQKSYSSHLERKFSDSNFEVKQKLTYLSGNTAIIGTQITNRSDKTQSLQLRCSSKLFDTGIRISQENDYLKLESDRSNAIGYIQFLNDEMDMAVEEGLSYTATTKNLDLKPGDSKSFLVSHTFIFPEYSWELEREKIAKVDFDALLRTRKAEKEAQLEKLVANGRQVFQDSTHAQVLAKAHLTLQNNWRIPAGELKHQGLFPSYHYEWFHGFWSWDSWKHAVGLTSYAPELAKDQMRAMFDFQLENGFIVDCVYRDTTIEAHNFRDTKPPLAAWAVAKILRTKADSTFAQEMYPKLKKYHQWWYADRDHDQDGLCEYGSTDGTLIAAKWESGMDNAIRFDDSKIVQNGVGAYSLDQESVDLNAYLYAEKVYLAEIAQWVQEPEESKTWKQEAEALKGRIQEQFFDTENGWYYDTNLEGNTFIKGAGSEGWIPLWANVASKEQAKAVRDKMMDPNKFNVKVPFQTMAADHPKFDPMNGYWRGPNWLDQAYFGIQGLRNYGYTADADVTTEKLLQGAQGLLQKGTPIHENYHPLTGKGLYAKNFSWSAAHLIMLLTNDK